MAKIQLTPEEFEKIQSCLNDGVEIPLEIVEKLSPSFFEKLSQESRFDFAKLDRFRIPTIEYAGKRLESTILASAAIFGQSAPLQVERMFSGGKMRSDEDLQMDLFKETEESEKSEGDADWRNLIVQGDNLQFLKTCYLNQDPLIKDKVKGKVKLIYIDPPFATKSDFGGKEGESSYSDKVERAEFLESLRERLVFLRELLADDGSIYIHLDQKMSHYVKILMDEVFGKDNFMNEIVWYYRRWNIAVNLFAKNHDIVLFYAKQRGSHKFSNLYIPKSEKSSAQGKAWKSIIGEDGVRRSVMTDEPTKGVPMPDVWEISMINPVGIERVSVNYPTQKPEALLERIISASSNENDVILDCFAGSGTTAAVAEKLGRRWIMCDFGKHAIYTIQKRILTIADSKKLGKDGKSNEKYGKPTKPFCVVSVGAFDFSKIVNLRKHKQAYIAFVLEMFGITERNPEVIKKFNLNNIFGLKDGNPVEVYPIWDDEYLKHIRIDQDYLQGIVHASEGKLKGDYYIIAPETCDVAGDTSIKNQNGEYVNFKLLTYPYKVLEEVSRSYQLSKNPSEQPSDAGDINNLISSTKFYFNEEIKAEFDWHPDGLAIKKFESNITDGSGKRFEGIDALAMVLIDKDYDGDIFTMEEAVYLKDIPHDKDGKDYGVVKVSGLTDSVGIIAVDKHGNESKVLVLKRKG